MTVRCKGCGKAQSWRNHRGSKISELKCNDCGGGFEIVSWHPEGGNANQYKNHKGQLFLYDEKEKKFLPINSIV